MKIHYRNNHVGTNLPWQAAFSKYGELSLGPVTSGGFPDEIDHLHLGGSCKGFESVAVSSDPITVGEIKGVQRNTGCSISVFFGDAVSNRFKFHRALLNAKIPKLQVYSATLYNTSMWRSDVNWVLHPTDEYYFPLVEHVPNDKVLFVGRINKYRRKIINTLSKAGIEVDVVGVNGNISPLYGRGLAEFSKRYTVSIGMFYTEDRPRERCSSTRLPNALAMGLVYIEAGFGLDGVFAENEIIQWEGVDDLVDKIRYYQKHVDEGHEVTMRGRKKVWTIGHLTS